MASSNNNNNEEVVRVKGETIAACMTCPLCNKLYRNATTIPECLHTFCRKCIYKKLSDEESDCCCPVCNIDLGCAPLEKLRPDHNWQDIRSHIFPLKKRKVKAREKPSEDALPVRRKERSLSSLGASTPRIPTPTSISKRKPKAVTRKVSAPQSTGYSIDEPAKKEEDYVKDLASSSSAEILNKCTISARQNCSTAEPSSRSLPKRETENYSERWEGRVDLWKPLNCLVEAANSDGHVHKSQVKEQGRISHVQDENNFACPGPPGSVKPKKLRKTRQKKAPADGEFVISPQTVLDAANTTSERKIVPVWFSLVASEDQKGDAPLPQISASYIRVNDGNVPVSFIQKYLMRKLDLASADEIEIRCMGELVLPTLQLNNLVDLWLRMSSSSEKVPTTIGSSAKDFVMVLTYARKVPPAT